MSWGYTKFDPSPWVEDIHQMEVEGAMYSTITGTSIELAMCTYYKVSSERIHIRFENKG